MDERLTIIEKTAFLKGVDVLADVPSEALLDLAMRARELHLDPGQTLIQAGDANQGSFLVMEGTLEERRGGALVRVVRPRMAVGELYLRAGETHHYTVRALEHAHVLHITIDDVFDSITDHPELGAAIVRALSLRVHELTSRTLHLEDTVHELLSAMRRAGVEPPDLRERANADAGNAAPAVPAETPR